MADNICSMCKQPVSDHDFNDGNFDIKEAGIQHFQCPQHQPSPSSVDATGSNMFGLWKEQHVSAESQYSHQSAGSCTINALETALRLQLGEQPSVQLINDVLILASLYKSTMHTGVGDVLPHVTRYNSTLTSMDWMQCSVKDLHKVTQRLSRNVTKSKHAVSCVITKPPETVFLHKCAPPSGQYILYDSHPRPEKLLNGSHLLVFVDEQLLNEYLSILFPFVNLGRGYGLYGDMMNQCDANFLQIDFAKHGDDAVETLREKVLNEIDFDAMSKDLSQIGFELEESFLGNQRKLEENQKKRRRSRRRRSSQQTKETNKTKKDVQNENEAEQTMEVEEEKKEDDVVMSDKQENVNAENDDDVDMAVTDKEQTKKTDETQNEENPSSADGKGLGNETGDEHVQAVKVKADKDAMESMDGREEAKANECDKEEKNEDNELEMNVDAKADDENVESNKEEVAGTDPIATSTQDHKMEDAESQGVGDGDDNLYERENKDRQKGKEKTAAQNSSANEHEAENGFVLVDEPKSEEKHETSTDDFLHVEQDSDDVGVPDTDTEK